MSETTEATTSLDPIEFKEKELTSSEKKKLKKQKKEVAKRAKTEHGFMYIGHLPHGFYEDQIKSYFNQFGRVLKVRLARSIKTGRYKGYGFVEFENVEVAQIAAETMNNYLMFNRILKCQLIAADKIHENTFKNSNKTFHTKLASKYRQRFNAKKSADQLNTIDKRNKFKMSKRMLKLKEAGINVELSKLGDSKLSVKKSEPVTQQKTKPLEKVTNSAKVETKKVDKSKPAQAKSVPKVVESKKKTTVPSPVETTKKTKLPAPKNEPKTKKSKSK